MALLTAHTRPPSRPFTPDAGRAARRRARRCTGPAASAGAAEQAEQFIKVCGVTNAEDAELAASTGANLIGMILWPKAKRSVATATARQIAAAARRHGAEPVGVFVDEDAATIARVCEAADVRVAQLHGDGARGAAVELLRSELRVVYVMHADKDGALRTPLPEALAAQQGRELSRLVDWIILDSLQGGSGESFDWRALHPPAASAARGWLLAGGLGPHNVAEAIEVARPGGVDVSSGVCGPDGLKKDVGKVVGFVQGAQAAFAAQRGQQQQSVAAAG